MKFVESMATGTGNVRYRCPHCMTTVAEYTKKDAKKVTEADLPKVCKHCNKTLHYRGV